ncbi:MAG TPA: glycosyl-4,4'-diaponeurosporenoate acyltransferase [Thermodesulfobacteriota bacterium]|nr:glycosyl-4,4'-diaponeurosporenoate acyltransferase [Thermodesulfobacteriota bacterium]
MRLIHLPTSWTVAADIAAWFLIHMGVAGLMVRVSRSRFEPDSGLFKIRSWERRDLYERTFRIRRWKRWLPDGSIFLGGRGFSMKNLRGRSLLSLREFCLETCRAEVTHWLILLFAPLFFLWNPFWVGGFMIVYALAENIPLILTQRYNRGRLLRLFNR